MDMVPDVKQVPIEQAIAQLQRGGLVAFPTETVYGLGADARRADAAAKIFAAKGRPPTNPLIVHVSGVAMAKLYTQRWPDAARLLAQRYWPGPLTLVLLKPATIPGIVTAGRPTVALRMPDHPLALELIRRFDGPVAAPSANRSTHVSPTTAQHVYEELGDAAEVILDGGPCRVGIESTVLDLSGPTPTILRPGGVTQRQIEQVIGPVALFSGSVSPAQKATSPGQHAIHYAPHTPAYRYEDPPPRSLDDARFGWLLPGGPRADARAIVLPDDPEAYARGLYAALRQLDAMGLEAIYIRMPPDEPRWLAVRDRLMRATRPVKQ